MKKKVFSFLLVLCIALSVPIQTIAALNGGNSVEGMIGFIAPPGTTAKANSVYSSHLAQNAIDGNITTRWNASLHKANIELSFPEPQDINFVQFATNATPPVNVEYTIYGQIDNQWVKVGGPTVLNLSGVNSINHQLRL